MTTSSQPMETGLARIRALQGILDEARAALCARAIATIKHALPGLACVTFPLRQDRCRLPLGSFV